MYTLHLRSPHARPRAAAKHAAAAAARRRLRAPPSPPTVSETRARLVSPVAGSTARPAQVAPGGASTVASCSAAPHLPSAGTSAATRLQTKTLLQCSSGTGRSSSRALSAAGGAGLHEPRRRVKAALIDPRREAPTDPRRVVLVTRAGWARGNCGGVACPSLRPRCSRPSALLLGAGAGRLRRQVGGAQQPLQ